MYVAYALHLAGRQAKTAMASTGSRGNRRKPKVLICTPEVTELPEGMGNVAHYIKAKGGGLGDISASLIRYLYEDGRFQLHVAVPKYESKIRDLFSMPERQVDDLTRWGQRVGVHLVTDSAFSHLPEVYADSESHPRVRRAEAFQRYIINHLLDALRPDVVHCNDWMTGLVPPAARQRGIKSVFTLHNVFTELETLANVDKSGIDVRRMWSWLYFERYPEDTPENWYGNRIDFTASGIHAADTVNTVSKTFLQELVRGDFPDITPPSIGATIRAKFEKGNALGVVNAPNDNVDPRTCPHIERFFTHDVMEKKRVNKQRLQRAMGLRIDPDAPLFFWPSRLYGQKGPELLLRLLPRLCFDLGLQVCVVANGEPAMEHELESLAMRSGGRVARRSFDAKLSDLGRAGADFVLMPSRYEPCGLPQMESPRFGTLPVARLTGGLRDTVFELDWQQGTGNGFTFEDYSVAAFEGAVQRAVGFYRQPHEVREAQLQRIMRDSFARFTLANTAQQYVQIYESLIESGRNGEPAKAE